MSRRKKTEEFDLSFVITGAQVTLDFEDGCFSDDEQEMLQSTAQELARRVIIDKSNVELKDNKSSHKFLLEDGWNFLCDVLVDTQYGKYMAAENQKFLAQSAEIMVCCYVMNTLEMMTDKVEHLALSVDPDSMLEILVCKDTSDEWRAFKGSWKDLDEDNGYNCPDKKNAQKRRRSGSDGRRKKK